MLNNILKYVISLAFLSILLIVSPLHTVTAGDFIQNCNIRVGGTSLDPDALQDYARFDLMFAQKFHYDDILGDSWGAIKNINPDIEIYVYYKPQVVLPVQDNYALVYTSNIARYNVDRGHSLGNLNIDNPTFFLLDATGVRLTATGTYDVGYWLDFGSNDFQTYAKEAIITDNVGQPWTTDGIFVDQAISITGSISGVPVLYDTDEKWAAAMNDMLNNLTITAHQNSLKLSGNRGLTRREGGYDAWLALDALSAPPDALMEEGAFAVSYGSSDVQFYNEADWKRQVDVLRLVNNSKLCYNSHTDLLVDESGFDNYGKPVEFWDVLWYSMGSYLIGRQDTSYFFLTYNDSYNITVYFDEYDNIDLGTAVSEYQILVHDGINIYWREFVDGFVYVNPTNTAVTGITIPEAAKLLSHDVIDLAPDFGDVVDTTTIDLEAHRAAILYNGTPEPPPEPPDPPTYIPTVYEDAEDGTIDGWSIYDNQPPGGTIVNVYNADWGSRVIQILGTGTRSGYELRNDDGTDWENTTQFISDWSISFSSPFSIYIDLETTVGQRYLIYTPVDYSNLGTRHVHHGLGSNADDGTWRTFSRDLQIDFEAAQPGVTVNRVDGFLIRGNGYIDDIELVKKP